MKPLQLQRTSAFFELRVSYRSGRLRRWSKMHLVLVDFKDFAKPLKLSRTSDISRPAKSKLFLRSD